MKKINWWTVTWTAFVTSILFFALFVHWMVGITTIPDFSAAHAIDLRISDEVCGPTADSHWANQTRTEIACDYEYEQVKPVATSTWLNSNGLILWSSLAISTTSPERFQDRFYESTSSFDPILTINGKGQIFLREKLIGEDAALGEIVMHKP
jgi:hypothetical protein